MADKDNHDRFSHNEFEEELKKGMADFKPTKDNVPLDSAGFVRELSAVMGNANSEAPLETTISVTIQCGRKSIGISLPTTDAELNKALLAIDALEKEYSIVKCQSLLAVPLDELIISGDINAVNYLAARLAEMPQAELDKLESVMQSDMKFGSIERLVDFTFNTDYFVLIPDITNTEDLARHYIFESGMVEMPRQWKDAIDLYAFGTNLEKQEKGTYTDKGYLLPSGDPWKQVFQITGIVPPEYRIDNYLKTAEMSTEQNYNQIDGVINNKAQPDADLTDGQTYDEIQELAPETLTKTEKPSILSQLKEAKNGAVKADLPTEKKPPNLEL